MIAKSYLHFEGLSAPVSLEGPAGLMPTIAEVFAKWPYSVSTAPQGEPFVAIRPVSDDMWEMTLAEEPNAPRLWDAVNVTCDLVAEMAWERLRTDPGLLCLHAAAVDFGGRLVVLPNARRAGKSTLTAALGHLGHEIFTDDFLPFCTDKKTAQFLGLANGVAPRIRLPLPDGFSDDFSAWVAQDHGPTNKQYKYLLNCPVASAGKTMPLGAIVVLDRQSDPCPTSLTEIPVKDALSTLVTQNFARVQHAGSILRAIDKVARHLPTYLLTYHSAEEAAQYLASQPALRSLPTARHKNVDQETRLAPLEMVDQAGPTFEPSLRYVQCSGVTVTQAGDESFLADQNGLSIYRLNTVSSAIWNLLGEPTDLDEVVEILTTAFSDADPDQVATDAEKLMRSLAAAQLITPVAASVAAQ